MSAPRSAPNSPGLRALKVLVVVMGGLIIAGVAVISATIADRLSGAASKASAAEAIADAAVGDKTLTLPPGARIVETVLSDSRLVLRTDGPDGAQLHLFHLPSGSPLGTLHIDSKP